MPQLTHLWIESPLMSNALDLLPGDVAILYPANVAEPDLLLAEPAQAILASSTIFYGEDAFRQLPNLKIVTRTGIGIDNVDLDAATRHGIVICNTPDGPTESTAEHAVGLLLAAAKRIKQGDANVAGGGFGPRTNMVGTEVMGKTLGLMGLGRIGSRVAHICGAGLGMRVIGFDPYLSPERAEALGVTLVDSPEAIFRQSDFVSLHAPATPETYRMVNAQSIATMKDGAYLINVSRGPLVDEAALLDALNSGKLAGAGLDVFDPEPPTVDNPLRRHPNVVLTPHSASLTLEGRTRMEVMAVERTLDFFAGNVPENVCNPAVLR
jgi:D-3-phosphoglycerate dehydrogenase